MILCNANDTEDLVTDNHFVPAVHVNNTDGLKVKAAIAAGGATAALTAGTALALDGGGVLAAFSSRGPQEAVPDLLKPDVTAPGDRLPLTLRWGGVAAKGDSSAW